ITEAVFRFGADVRSGDDQREAQLRMIRDGEAMAVENSLSIIIMENREFEACLTLTAEEEGKYLNAYLPLVKRIVRQLSFQADSVIGKE
ncbi:chromosome partition protein MukE, partial [Yersinia pestis]|uniref:chromosome partition protein MukE n=1 Tax=Yersinia pestis TaxID=632 RepID=UPI001EE46274